MQRGRRVSFDYGDVRIGVAASDADSILVSPLTTLTTSSKNLFTQIQTILEQLQPVAIYVGRPTHMSGHAGLATEKSEQFAQRLSELTNVPIHFVDERLSTVSAARNLRNAGRNAKTSKGSIDEAAAVEILNFAIELEKSRP